VITVVSQALKGVQSVVSEYQNYEFVALDRPLTVAEMAELRSISTRAQITPTAGAPGVLIALTIDRAWTPGRVPIHLGRS
jgi:hypothetical protein